MGLKLGLVALTGGLPLAIAVVPVQAVPVDPCTLLTRAQAQHLLLGKRVAKVKETMGTTANQALLCVWATKFFQTDEFKRLNDPFSLKLTVQPTATAAAGLNQIRSQTPDFYQSVPNLGDEAYEGNADLVIVSGPTVVEIRVSNFDTSKKPHPDVEQIVKSAAPIILANLAASH